MKLKKAIVYLISFCFIGALFSGSYYLSYLHALKNFNNRAIEQSDNLYPLLEKAQPTAAAEADENETEDVIQNEVQNEATVKPTTKYTLDIVDMKTNTTKTEELNPPSYFIGLTRDEIVEYLDNYMDDMPLSEYNKGLISYELVRFSEDNLEIKKSYNEDFVPFRFYVVVKNGYVVVYNSDLKSVYSYTHIEAQNLPEEDRIALIQGIYVNSLDELYALLESYSS